MTKFNHLSAPNHRSSIPALQSILSLYIDAFPADERREWTVTDDICDFIDSHADRFHIITIEHEDRFAGFVTYWDFSSHIYVEHLAIIEEMRSHSLGTQLLQHLIDTISPDILLEVEHPTPPEAVRRITFYRHRGFTLRDDIPYIQPPYSPRLSPTPLILMTHGNVSPDDDLIATLKRIVYDYPPTK